MILIGMFDSPFVRRVAVSMRLLDIPFEHRDWSVGRDFERIRAHNPLGRVPTLVLDDGEALFESAAILEYLDELVGPWRALLPAQGPDRRRALNLMALAIGAAEKGVQQVYEIAFRPPERRHAPWTDRCAAQMQAALTELDRRCEHLRDDAWLLGARISQADVTAACAVSFLDSALHVLERADAYPHLRRLAARCEALPAFRSIRADFVPPKAGG